MYSILMSIPILSGFSPLLYIKSSFGLLASALVLCIVLLLLYAIKKRLKEKSDVYRFTDKGRYRDGI